MLFNSYEFLFGFLPCFLLVLYCLRFAGAIGLAKFWLIGASLFFYAWWDWRFLPLLVLSAVFNWVVGNRIAAAETPAGRRLSLVVGLTVDIAVLAFFKYYLFLIDVLSFSLSTRSSAYIWLLPLGISFWTFEQIIYLVDCYRKQQRPLDFSDYLAFVTFFPRLIAGPIIKPRDFLQSYGHWQTPIGRNFIAAGLTMVAIGLFKKVCLADSLGRIATPIFKIADDGFPVVAFDAWAGTLAFSFQIYFDFSGYSDIAIGLALMVGIRLPPNFDSPYRSRSIIEFWRRWHISLSSFLRDYLYIPLGGNRNGRWQQASNVMITMALGGLWHGAGINFLIWGVLHGLYIVVAHTAGRFVRLTGWLTYISAALTFAAVLIAWVFFRADSLEGAWRMLLGLSGQPQMWLLDHSMPRFWGAYRLFGDPLQIALLAYCAFHVFFLPSTTTLFRTYVLLPQTDATGYQWQPTTAWSILAAILASASIWLMLGSRVEFIYFQF